MYGMKIDKLEIIIFIVCKSDKTWLPDFSTCHPIFHVTVSLTL